MQGVDITASAVTGGNTAGAHTALNDVVDALMVLGYSRAEAMDALRGMDATVPTEDLIRMALKKLMRG